MKKLFIPLANKHIEDTPSGRVMKHIVPLAIIYRSLHSISKFTLPREDEQTRLRLKSAMRLVSDTIIHDLLEFGDVFEDDTKSQSDSEE